VSAFLRRDPDALFGSGSAGEHNCAISEMGMFKGNREAINILLGELGNSQGIGKGNAAVSLGDVLDGETDERVIKVLIRSLRDRELYVRQWVARAIGKTGTRSVRVLLLLCLVWFDKDVNVEAKAGWALSKVLKNITRSHRSQ
jgi:hypothetical protein